MFILTIFVMLSPQIKISTSGMEACPHLIWKFSPGPEMYFIKKKTAKESANSFTFFAKNFCKQGQKNAFIHQTVHTSEVSLAG